MMQKIDRKEFVQGVAALSVSAAVGISFGKEGSNMKKTELKTLANENAFDLIGKEWMLVTAGNKEKFNTMTASWGGIGWLWNRPVAFVFIRPERYTHDFIERESRLTLSFYKEEFRGILHFCGTKSGRDVDKVKETGLKPVALESGAMTFEQARLTLDCRCPPLTSSTNRFSRSGTTPSLAASSTMSTSLRSRGCTKDRSSVARPSGLAETEDLQFRCNYNGQGDRNSS